MQKHLIGRTFVGQVFVQLLVKPHFVVVKSDFLALFDGFVCDFDVVKEVFVARFVPFFDGIHVLYVRFEVAPAERYEFVYKLLGVRRIYVSRRKNAVDKKSQFGVFDFACGKIRAFFAAFYIEPHFFQIGKIASDGFSFTFHAVIACEQIYYVLLRERMLVITVFFKNLIYPHYESFLCFECHIRSFIRRLSEFFETFAKKF